jgi:hypothetical protein
MLRDQNEVYLKLLDTFENDVYKGLLSILVLLFHQTRYEEAEEELDKAQMVASFSLSDEATAAEALMNAYRQVSLFCSPLLPALTLHLLCPHPCGLLIWLLSCPFPGQCGATQGGHQEDGVPVPA